jgi:hypothetical protein
LLAEDEEVGMDINWLSSQRVGQLLRKLRLHGAPRAFKGPRGWQVSVRDVNQWIQTYGLNISERLVDKVASIVSVQKCR